MNANELRAEIARHELTIPKLADMMQMSKKTLYSRVKGETSFTQQEISLIANVLSLSKERIIDIFFDEEVA
jgi:plasmid maintenance system antidote protein VapI